MTMRNVGGGGEIEIRAEAVRSFEGPWGIRFVLPRSLWHSINAEWNSRSLYVSATGGPVDSPNTMVLIVPLPEGETASMKSERETPHIVCLCGSTRFSEAFRRANLEETLKGNIVLSVGSMTHSDADILACVRCGALDDYKGDCLMPDGLKSHDFHPLDSKHHIGTKGKLDALHKQKIELADEVFILNVIACKHCKAPLATTGTGFPCPVAAKGFLPTADPVPEIFQHDFAPYIGESTKSEFAHAMKLKKPVRFLNKMSNEAMFKLLDETHDARYAQ